MKMQHSIYQLRRLRFDLIYYYKVLNNLTPFDSSELCIPHPLGLDLKCHTCRNQLKQRIEFSPPFFFRSTDAWNALPAAALRSSSSVSVFKRHLKQFDLSTFLKGSARHLCI
jgi:hypothetical protein